MKDILQSFNMRNVFNFNIYRIMVKKYSYVHVAAKTEDEVLRLTNSMTDHDFDLSDFDEAQIVEDDVEGDLKKRFQKAIDDNEDELNFFMDLLDDGFTVDLIRECMGDEKALYMERYC